MLCDECDYPLAEGNVPLLPRKNVKNFCYVCHEMKAAVSAREWFKALHNEWLNEQSRRRHITGGSSEDD